MADVDAVKGKVQRLLADEFGQIAMDRDGDFTIRSGSARVFISVFEVFGGEATAVRAYALTNVDVPETPELLEFLALNNSWTFGALSARRMDDGNINISFGMTILGDTLDPEELLSMVVLVGRTADDIDDEIQSRFGGSRFHED